MVNSNFFRQCYITVSMFWYLNIVQFIIIIIIISNLSNDRSKASSKTIPKHSAI